MYSPRPDSFTEWLLSLNEGDELRITYLWMDKGKLPAWVKSKGTTGMVVHWMTFDDAVEGIARHHAKVSLPSGGNTDIRIHHPTRAVIYHPKLGYEFEDRVEFFLGAGMEGNPL